MVWLACEMRLLNRGLTDEDGDADSEGIEIQTGRAGTTTLINRARADDIKEL